MGRSRRQRNAVLSACEKTPPTALRPPVHALSSDQLPRAIRNPGVIVGGPPRRDALACWADVVRYRRGARDPHGCGKCRKPVGDSMDGGGRKNAGSIFENGRVPPTGECGAGCPCGRGFSREFFDAQHSFAAKAMLLIIERTMSANRPWVGPPTGECGAGCPCRRVRAAFRDPGAMLLLCCMFVNLYRTCWPFAARFGTPPGPSYRGIAVFLHRRGPYSFVRRRAAWT